jgi:raffinose/stachyose/melibiose transport system permease protein
VAKSARARAWQNFGGRPWAWLAPAFVLLTLLLFYPMAFNLALSFFDWDGFQRNPFATFVGLNNYLQLIQDPIYAVALRNTLTYVFFAITIQNVVAFVTAVFLFLGKFRGSTLLRAIIFFPSVLSAVVVSLVWRNIVLLRGGLVHQVTQALGLPEFFPLGDPSLAFYVIVLVGIWQSTGFNLVIFYAGLQSLDQEILEAAELDGANFWSMIWRVVAPLQSHVMLACVVLNLIGGFQVFDLVFVMTRAGPAHTTEVLASYMIFNSFTAGQHQFSYAAAISTSMMVMTLIFAGLRARVARRLAS